MFQDFYSQRWIWKYFLKTLNYFYSQVECKNWIIKICNNPSLEITLQNFDWTRICKTKFHKTCLLMTVNFQKQILQKRNKKAKQNEAKNNNICKINFLKAKPNKFKIWHCSPWNLLVKYQNYKDQKALIVKIQYLLFWWANYLYL